MLKTLERNEMFAVNGGKNMVRVVPRFYGDELWGYCLVPADSGIVEYRYDCRSDRFDPLYEHYRR